MSDDALFRLTELGKAADITVECAHVDCVRDEPTELVVRGLHGTDYRETYCGRHDPLDDPAVADVFEAVDADG